VKKRKWEDLPEGGLDPNFDPSERVKRRKSIILLGYSGVNYHGMQRNPDMKTIEEDLLATMLKHKWITEEHYKTPQTIQFQRAARTDKGVSACTQVVSIKLRRYLKQVGNRFEIESMVTFILAEQVDIEALNKDLPQQIKVFAIKRVTKGFNSKTNCDARTYTYTMPTIALADHAQEVDMATYRLPDDKLQKVNEVLKLYEGTKNYHNFTRRKVSMTSLKDY
jgi:tRNA pseudouridine38-40 synthase